ncbi:Protein of uncharacterised function (DUF3703) [Delftia tsuruhatensis]|uniref:DUF3703 domain-containing protein n=1 Tax=Delftia tsuruhatensis TaxID=180282 RepID=UPI001E748303|nr:DUF3703 domain-containing protein [Delftia tsuruhatensis]CAB5711707.1 Protein of uncharacterised function (DUF3703) [Delftia tsuruhatensis]CAC9686906.1 Protein of uncharacterised function (DUF3703) [Delftia tsuruhatensis]
MTPGQRRAAFAHLLGSFRASADQPPQRRWLLLEASHVLGQEMLGLHWRSHWWMLRHALQLRDAGEVSGQLLRLALVPAGHLLNRLPRGNIGRATVPATLPMEMPPAISALIAEALRATRGRTARRPPA